jgi:hypothetical protein
VTTATPANYTAFRIALVAVTAAVLGAAVVAVLDPPVLAAILDFLGLGGP